MAPIYRERMNPDLQALVQAISDQPVWIDNPNEDGNAATSPAYRDVLGIDCADWDWEKCVQNPDYCESYEAWRERGPVEEQWVYPLRWRRPDTGQVITGYGRAQWTPSGFIVGTVHVEPAYQQRPVPRWGAVLLTLILTCCAFAGGCIAAGWT